MFEMEKSVQRMIECVEEGLDGNTTLEKVAQKANYSPYYATKKFHEHTGMTLRDYIRMRKVSQAVLDLRNTDMRILDIAVKYGFSSQEAFTRSFKKAFGLNPSTYRKWPKPLPLLIKRNVYNPYYLGLGELKHHERCKKRYKLSQYKYYLSTDLSESRILTPMVTSNFGMNRQRFPGQDCDTDLWAY